jgi:hypothetical protein
MSDDLSLQPDPQLEEVRPAEEQPSGPRYRSGEEVCVGDLVCGPTHNRPGLGVGIVVRVFGGPDSWTVEFRGGIRVSGGLARIDASDDWADPAKLIKVDLREGEE